jgi:hypothetical protein
MRGEENDIDSKEFVLAGIVMKRLLSEGQTAGGTIPVVLEN